MQAPARWAALATAAVACAALAGCSGPTSSGGSAANSPAPIVTVPPPGGAGSTPGVGKLTGNFCTDAKNVGNNIHIPPSAMSSLNAMQKTGVTYLSQLATYFNGLAGEAPAQVGKALHTLAGDYQQVAGAVSSGDLGSLTKVEQQLESLTSSGAASNAFSQLVAYMVRNCK